jgi:hypothetical protein
MAESDTKMSLFRLGGTWMIEESLVDSHNELSLGELNFILFGHAAFQYLNAGCALGVFELLQSQPGLTRGEVSRALCLEELPTRILLFGLAALKLVRKDGRQYRNSSVITQKFEAGGWQAFRDTVMFEARIVYAGQAHFVESLRANANLGLQEIPGNGRDLYHRLGENPELSGIFYSYMGSWSRLANPCLLRGVDFRDVETVLDVGGGDATNAIDLVLAHPHLRVTLLEIAECCSRARDRVSDAGLEDRISVVAGDMLHEPIDGSFDCVMFIHQLVIWSPGVIRSLLGKAYEVIRPQGKVVIFNSMASDDEDGPLMSALDSVYFMTLPAPGGMIYPWREYESALLATGFDSIGRIRCEGWTPHGIIVARRP